MNGRKITRGDAAFANIGTKVSKGRTTTGEAKVPDVETLECRPAFGSLPALQHELENDARGRTRCKHCGRTWADLDEAVRAA